MLQHQLAIHRRIERKLPNKIWPTPDVQKHAKHLVGRTLSLTKKTANLYEIRANLSTQVTQGCTSPQDDGLISTLSTSEQGIASCQAEAAPFFLNNMSKSADTSALRIISLLPSATEIIFALGAGRHVVGVTHECDFPKEASRITHCTGNLLPPGLTARQIDDAVSRTLEKDTHSIYSLDVAMVRQLQPTVIVTQSLCAVCAVPEKMVKEVSCTLPYDCSVISSDPHNLWELFDSITHIGKLIGFTSSAKCLVERMKARLNDVRASVSLKRPRVVVIEWPDPLYAPGHWVPDMISYSGGECVLGASGEKSEKVSWEQVADLKPDVIICAFCGYDLRQNEEECDKIRTWQSWRTFSRCAEVYASDASAYFSRPGNRLVDGTELLAFILHRIPCYKPSSGCGSLLVGEKWVDLSQL